MTQIPVQLTYHIRCPKCNAALAQRIDGSDFTYLNRCWRCKKDVELVRQNGVDIRFEAR